MDAMYDIMDKIMREGLQRGVNWIEIRMEDTTFEYIDYINGNVKNAGIDNHLGMGIRVMIKGKVGFSSASGLDVRNYLKALDEAIKIAEIAQSNVKLSQEDSIKADYKPSGYRKHPTDVDFSEKIKLVKTVYETAREVRVR